MMSGTSSRLIQANSSERRPTGPAAAFSATLRSWSASLPTPMTLPTRKTRDADTLPSIFPRTDERQGLILTGLAVLTAVVAYFLGRFSAG